MKLDEGGRNPGHAGLLQRDDHQRQPVDETNQIRPGGVERTGDAELAGQPFLVIVSPSDAANTRRLSMFVLMEVPRPQLEELQGF